MLRSIFSKSIRFCDNGLGRVSDYLLPSSSSLVIFTFHTIFASHAEVESGVLDPQQGITAEMFRKFIADFQAHDYRFVSPHEIVDGVDPKLTYALITFDDGYHNNLRALPILEEFHVPAVFCISTNYVKTGRSFWWDALYREAQKRKWTAPRINEARISYKLKRTSEIEDALGREFGRDALDPVSDLDRPMTQAELVQLAGHPLCSIGNHTTDHAILTNYTQEEIRNQIGGAQEFIQTLTGKTPELIAYPNGNVSSEVARIARTTGLLLGVTVQPGKNRLNDLHNPDKALTLKRFTLWGNRDVEAQCRNARAVLNLTSAMSEWRMKSRIALTN